MRLGEAVFLATAALVPFGQAQTAQFKNGRPPQANCEFGSVLDYFEELPPIPRTCLAPLAKLATPQCSELLGIQDATAYIAPQSTEAKEVLTTTLKTSTFYETIALRSTTTVGTFETETRTSTRTTMKLVYQPIPTAKNKTVTVTVDPVTKTTTTTLTTHLASTHAYPRRQQAQAAPSSVSIGDSKSNCDILARNILGLSHESSVLSGACACLQLTPRTTTITGGLTDTATKYIPGTLTEASTSTVTKIHTVTSTVTKLHVQSVTEKGTTTKVVPAVVTATMDVCKRGYKGTKQNGIWNKVVHVPRKQAPSQAECCRRCGHTANCVASAWVPVAPPQARDTTNVKPACQLLIKARPVVLSSDASDEAEKLFVPNKTQMCPLGIEVYDFGEESAEGEGVVFRGPCSVPKRR